LIIINGTAGGRYRGEIARRKIESEGDMERAYKTRMSRSEKSGRGEGLWRGRSRLSGKEKTRRELGVIAKKECTLNGTGV